MVTVRLAQLLALAGLISALHATGDDVNHLVIAPQAPVLEIGTNFTATCMIINTAEVTADDLYWKLTETVVPKEQCTKINTSALSVTVPISGEKPEWLYCISKKVSSYVDLNNGKFIHGIILTKGYRPEKPENLSCVAAQERTYISPTITCVWEPVGYQTQYVPTTFTLNVGVIPGQVRNVLTHGNSGQVTLDIFPNHMILDIWVEAQNILGTVESEHLREDAGWFVKTNPPSWVTVISEKNFPISLLINWTHPIAEEYVRLKYQIRFCPDGSHRWTYVPLVDTSKYILSFRLQKLEPDTVYVTQVRCKNARDGHGHWSSWSTNTTQRTPEDRPKSKPDLWRIVAESDGRDGRHVQFICKDPVVANGRIKRFDIKILDQKDKVHNMSWESVPVNWSEADRGSSQRRVSLLKQIHLADHESVRVNVTAFNSVGKSPEASLVISEKSHELPAVEQLKVWSHGGRLWLDWKSPSSRPASEYVVEWAAANASVTDWQRENRSTRRTAIKGSLEKLVCYTVSVSPVFSGWIGKPASQEAFLEQGAPLEGPAVRLDGKPGRNDAKLLWKEIPRHRRQGFITNYTIFYKSGTTTHAITVPGNTTSYTLTSLSGNTKYDIWIMASTVRGSNSGFTHSFTTLKYAPGEIEGIVVGVSFGFLFILLLIMLLCIYKRNEIKENVWPWIPNPGESTIGNWSPDYPLKAESPKESCLSGIGVLDVDACDGRSVFEEDKASLPLKKDKYLSEEHSSGIGGSSCMSSPRQSVSDSDEGGDAVNTTASTVQYSSVVASNGYKGQTPSCQPQQAMFSRSESTQPLLDCEENSDMLLQDCSKPPQRFHQQPSCRYSTQKEDTADHNQPESQQQEGLDVCPLREESEQKTSTDSQSQDWMPVAPASSYMPQLGSYRPQ